MSHFSVSARPLTFRRFSRKNWSLFACLHREVRIGVLTVATLLTASPRLSGATLKTVEGSDSLSKNLPTDTLSLAEATVSASRAPLRSGMAARQVVTLGREELSGAGVKSLNDVLKLNPCVDVRQRAGFGIQTDISIDGGTHDQISLFIDGVPIVNPQTGHNAADFPINLSDVERIEIIDGADSRVAGSQAFSGSIHIITRRDTVSSPLEATVEGGSYGTLRTAARTAWTLPNGWSVSGSGSWQRSDGAVKNGSFQSGKAFARIARTAEDFDFSLFSGVTASDFGANTFYSAAYPDQWETLRRFLVAAQAETKKGRLRFQPRVSWLRNVDHFQLIHHSNRGENYHSSDVYDLSLNTWTDWAWGRTAFGAELRQDHIFSSNLGKPMQEDQWVGVPGAPGKHYTMEDERTNISYFIEHNARIGRLSLSAGVVAQKNSAVAGGFRFYPGADLSLRLNHGSRLYLSFNRSLRLPSFTEWYYKSPTQEGNVNLQPEESTDLRLGYGLKNGIVKLDAQVHYRRCQNLIDWIMRTADDIYHATAFSTDDFGARLDLDLDLDEWWGTKQPFTSFSVGYAWLNRHRRSGEAFYKSNYAMEPLRHNFVVRLSHRIVKNVSADWTLRGRDREGSFIVYQGGQSTGELRSYGFHALLDCKVTWKQPHYSLFVDMTNLTSHRYYDLANVLQPGFLLMAGVNFKL